MTSHVGRLYSLALALIVFFLAWALVAARPWRTATADPRWQQLAVHQAQLKHEATLVQQIVTLRRRQHAAAVRTATPSVRVVDLPPLTITRTS
jgi:hypothetical protein